jgi:hypothetical protein
MRRPTILIFVLLLAISCVSPSSADSAASVRKTLQALYDRSNQAFGRRDLQSAYSIFDPSCTIVDQNGRSAGTESLYSTMERYVAAAKTCHSVTRILKCTVATVRSVETATVITTDTTTIVYRGTDGAWTNLKLTAKARDYWAHAANGWKILQNYTMSEQEWMNGQKVDTDQ